MKVLVSACLLGRNCKYNGGNNYHPEVARYVEDKEVIAVCPEVLGGMPVPRTCVEIVNGVLMDKAGNNVDEIFRRGVSRAMEQIKGMDIELAILQSRSPTCGVSQIYDGSFSGRLIEGQGIFAEALQKAGYTVIDVQEFTHRSLPTSVN